MGNRHNSILDTIGNTPAVRINNLGPKHANILCMLPDTGERYQSTTLFDDIGTEMNAEEFEISCSTPACRFDVSEPAADEPAVEVVEMAEQVALDPAAVNEVDSVIKENPGQVVMFSLEWCEFCWSVRKMMSACDIPYTTVDLDSVAYQENDRGGNILEVLKQRNDWPTIPQIYLGDEFVGGATDLFDVGKARDLEEKLDAQNIPYNETIKRDPYTFLPDWLHPS